VADFTIFFHDHIRQPALKTPQAAKYSALKKKRVNGTYAVTPLD